MISFEAKGFLENEALKCLALAYNLGEGGKVEVKAQEGKRASRLETETYNLLVKDFKKEFGSNMGLIIEGFPVYENLNAEIFVSVDPIDGTTHHVQDKSPNLSLTGAPIVATGIAIYQRRKGRELTFDDHLSSVIFTLTGNRQIFVGEKDKSSYLAIPKGLDGNSSIKEREEISAEINEKDNFILSTDFYWAINSEIRTELKNPKDPRWRGFDTIQLGCGLSHPIAVSTGKAWSFFCAAGLAAWEATAAYPILKGAGAYTISLGQGKDLGGEELGEVSLDKIFFTGENGGYNGRPQRVPILSATNKKWTDFLYKGIKDPKNYYRGIKEILEKRLETNPNRLA